MSTNNLLSNPDPAVAQKQAEKDFVAPAVIVGEPCVLWYPHADKNTTPSPCAVNESSNGILTVTVFAKNSMPYTKTGVRHVDDPFHATHKTASSQNGGWDYNQPALRETKLAQRRKELAKIAQQKEAAEKARLAAEEAARKAATE